MAEGTEIARVSLPGKPAAVAVDPRGGRVYAVSVEPGALWLVSAEGEILAEFTLPGWSPLGLALDPVSGRAYVSDWAERRVVEVSPDLKEKLREFPTGGAPSGLAVSADGRRLVVAERDENSLLVIDLASGESFSVRVGEHPFGVTLRGGLAFTADVLSNTVSVADLEKREKIAEIPTGERPYAVAFAKGRGFVTNQYSESLTVFDAESLAAIGEIAVGEYPEGIAATADESRLWVANWFSDHVSLIDPEKLETVGEIPAPAGPRAFGAFIGPREAAP
ncbi:YncE family protein [Neomegalonema perideroedes]|uniref:YncE family protein n=1 Tax=Neomegalonema perideroedes TaxID=217219 RepID=UPI0003687D8D|nr:YncE family protein [Neomegalonema perideroedes]